MTRPIPRTTSTRATGTCGHAFTNRFPLPYGLAGEERTPARVAALEQARAERAERLGESICPDCFAATMLEATRGAVERLAAVLERPAPPRMTGCSARMASFAEGIRSDLIWREATTRTLAVRDALRHPSAGEAMTLAALRAAWPDQPFSTDEPVAPDIERLAQQMRAVTSSGLGSGNLSWVGGGMSHADWLAVWLVQRAEWARTWTILGDARPRAWIAARRRMSRPPDAEPDRVAVGAACLVARIGGWEDRGDAAAAFEVLAGSSGTLAEVLAAGEGSLQQRVLSAAVMDALSPAADPFPF